MSKRWILVAVLFLGVVTAVFLFHRKEASEGLSFARNEGSDVPSQERERASSKFNGEDPKPSSMPGENLASKTSSTILSSLEGRSVRADDRPIKNGLRSFNSDGARYRDDALLKETEWKIWLGVTAYPKAQGEPATSGTRLGEINNYYLIDEGFHANTENFQRPIVVYDPKNDRAGVLTGVYGVVLEDGADAEFLTQDPDIKVIAPFTEINTYYITSAAVPFNLQELLKRLRHQPNVKDVHLEILSRQYEKQ